MAHSPNPQRENNMSDIKHILLIPTEGDPHGHWKAVAQTQYKQEGCWAVYRVRDAEVGMAALREMFPEGEATETTLVVFSTSGVHGSYRTIEEAEREGGGAVTFQIHKPRVCCLQYGNCCPRTPDDFAYLKRLRQSSWEQYRNLGR